MKKIPIHTLRQPDVLSGYSGRKVLITGGLGLIGSNLALRLVELGAYVTIVDALLPLYGGNLFNISPAADRLKVNFADIRDINAMNQLVRGQNVIFNLAAQVSYTDSQKEPLLDLDINCRGHLNFLEACRINNPEARLLFAGSRMQYGHIKSNPVNESHTMYPLTIYGVHKVTGESYYNFYYRVHGIETVSLRISNPYGPRHQMKHSKYGIVNHFIKLAETGKPIRIFGDGQQIRDYIYVGDIVEVFLQAGIAEDVAGEAFNVGSGIPATFLEMAKTVIKTVGKGTIEHIPWPDNYERIETGNYVADINKARAMLNWEPKVSLTEGIAKTVSYYRRYHDYYWKTPGTAVEETKKLVLN